MVAILISMALMTCMVTVSVFSHQDMETDIRWHQESVIAFSLDVNCHEAQRWIEPLFDIFDEVAKFTHVQQSIAVHV